MEEYGSGVGIWLEAGKEGLTRREEENTVVMTTKIRLTTQWKKEIKHLYKMPFVFEVFLFACAPLRPMGTRDLTS
jgi:hypothetical protein